MLNNKNIVIIGGTTGIGFSAAKAFIEHGSNVVVVGRHPYNEWKNTGKKTPIKQAGYGEMAGAAGTAGFAFDKVALVS